MPNSYFEAVDVICPHCGEAKCGDVWFVVDVAERPDLAERIRNATLHDVYCRACGEQVCQADSPLLVYQPGSPPKFWFCLGEGWSADENFEFAANLTGRLRKSLAKGWREEWSQQIAIVSSDLLSQAIEDCQAASTRQDPPAPVASPAESGRSLKFPPAFSALLQQLERSQDFEPDTVIDTLQEVLATKGLSGNQTAALKGILGESLALRFQHSGSNVDLDAAIAALREASEVRGGHPQWAHWEDLLAELQHARFKATGEVADLEAAMVAATRAAGAAEAGTPMWATHNLRLASIQREHGELFHDLADLDRSSASFNDVLRTATTGSSIEARGRAGLANVYVTRFTISGDSRELEEGIRFYRAVLVAAPGEVESGAWLHNLGNALLTRAMFSGASEDLDASIDAHRKASALARVGSLESALRQADLASALRERADRFRDPADREAAASSYESALSVYRARNVTMHTMETGHALGSLYFGIGAWSKAAAVLTEAVRSANELYRSQSLGRGQEAWLRRAGACYRMAAYALARSGALEEASATIEQGRARALSWILGRPLTRGDSVPPVEPSWSDIAAAADAAAAAIVYLICTTAGSLALIVSAGSRADHAAVEVLWLGGFSQDQLEALLVGSDTGPGDDHGGWLGAYDRRQIDVDTWTQETDGVTGALWQTLVGPIIDRLSLMAVERAVFVPAELLALLPLHAAWTEDSSMPTGRRYALDVISIRYAPNARAVLVAQTSASGSSPDAILAVSEPTSAYAGALPNAGFEVEVALAGFPRSRRLSGGDATRAAVLEELSNHQVLHFACHGAASIQEPLRSGLLLADDEMLEVRDILNLRRLAGVRLAVLSACESNVQGIQLPDEVVSLPTALLQAGAAGVIGSQWSVVDLSTTILLTRFYELWRGARVEPAEALRQSQQWLRDSTYGQMAAYFMDQLTGSDRASDEWRMPTKAARALYQSVALRPPHERGMRYPAMWAAFSYVGA